MCGRDWSSDVCSSDLSNKSLKKLKAQKDNLEEDHEALKNWSKTKAQTLDRKSVV